ncbi:hypothetical protein G4H71_09045 [Rhodococcus triatomae]|nr:hypothetical protein [Rhodococcus triatomae]QNG20926.1 hypothetical protein G4H72_21340 [Rhodococcus triatomae]QNG23159.1 hypothetical protein G4H71_09045 [Rhodococcus triatomae]
MTNGMRIDVPSTQGDAQRLTDLSNRTRSDLSGNAGALTGLPHSFAGVARSAYGTTIERWAADDDALCTNLDRLAGTIRRAVVEYEAQEARTEGDVGDLAKRV